MKFRGNKGQGAMEYLMTYGWAILVVMIVGVVLWQLGVFNVGQESVVTTGWAKLKPISASIAYRSGGAFETTFQNTVGTSIKITNISVAETLLSENCTDLYVKDVAYTGLTSDPNVLWYEGSETAKAGDGFEVTGTCPTTLNEGDPFDLEISIDYTAVMGGVSTSHRETGHIRGPVEA